MTKGGSMYVYMSLILIFRDKFAVLYIYNSVQKGKNNCRLTDASALTSRRKHNSQSIEQYVHFVSMAYCKDISNKNSILFPLIRKNINRNMRKYNFRRKDAIFTQR